MLVLGIESSCDETAAAVVERGKVNRVLSQRVKSQIMLHEKFGGVVPEIAARNHYEVIDSIVGQALADAGVRIADIDLIAVTQGPGLIGSLLIGLTFAKSLAYTRRIPLVGVDHILAHSASVMITHSEISFPLVSLVVSGGHTTLFYFAERFNPRVVAKTRDDAAGELFDKICKFFRLGYPGGPVIDRLFEKGDSSKFSFSFPQMSDGTLDFSFSGYKTAVLRYAGEQQIESGSRQMYDLLSSLLSSVVDYLLKQTLTVADMFSADTILVSGGVSCNSLLRKRFTQQLQAAQKKLYLAAPEFSTDNAAMVAWLGYEKYCAFPDENYFDLTLNAYSRATFRQSSRHR